MRFQLVCAEQNNYRIRINFLNRRQVLSHSVRLPFSTDSEEFWFETKQLSGSGSYNWLWITAKSHKQAVVSALLKKLLLIPRTITTQCRPISNLAFLLKPLRPRVKLEGERPKSWPACQNWILRKLLSDFYEAVLKSSIVKSIKRPSPRSNSSILSSQPYSKLNS